MFTERSAVYTIEIKELQRYLDDYGLWHMFTWSVYTYVPSNRLILLSSTRLVMSSANRRLRTPTASWLVSWHGCDEGAFIFKVVPCQGHDDTITSQLPSTLRHSTWQRKKPLFTVVPSLFFNRWILLILKKKCV